MDFWSDQERYDDDDDDDDEDEEEEDKDKIQYQVLPYLRMGKSCAST